MVTLIPYVRKSTQGFVGYVQVVDGPMRWSERTHVVRLTKKDALQDARDVINAMRHRNRHTSKTTNSEDTCT